MDYAFECSIGKTLTKEELAACLAVIKEGCAVDSVSAKRELPKAKAVVTVRFGDEIVAVGVIKRARPRYAAKIATYSGFSFDKNMLELGYVARKESHSGNKFSQQIVARLLAVLADVPLFATTSHKTMKATLKAAGFVRQGREWPGRKKNKLSLWIKDGASRTSSVPLV